LDFSLTITLFCPSSKAWGNGAWFGTTSLLIFGRAVGAYSGRFNSEILLEALQEFEVMNISAIASHYRLIMDSGKIENYKEISGHIITRS
jgi:acyl-coenzyme A synthetase/AMP-(fatty) acid ligase